MNPSDEHLENTTLPAETSRALSGQVQRINTGEQQMAKQLTLGTAIITRQHDLYVVRYMNHGSFLVGTQMFAAADEARHFCSYRALRVI